MRTFLLATLVVFAACRYPNADQRWDLTTDADGDGYTSDVDCNDNNADIHPGADETCDGQDDNCNGQVDDNAIDQTTWYFDGDADGYAADGADSQQACDQPDGYADQTGDCDDNDKDINPGATDIPGDGIDQNCNGHDAMGCYADTDHDGYGDLNSTTISDTGSCDTAAGQADNPEDCDDNHATVYPTAPDLCDGLQNDCDNWASPTDPGALPADEIDDDDDGYVACDFAEGVTAANWGNVETPAVIGGSDCAPDNPARYPNAPELCDGKINACGSTLPSDEVDDDDDGYVECDLDVAVADWGHVETPPVIGGGDCNDDSAATYPRVAVTPVLGTHPAAGETYEAADGCYTDADDDGFGADPGATGATAGTDCDDSSASAYPGGNEIVGDAIDQDCNSKLTCYVDTDGDGHGTDAPTSNTIEITASSCDQPAMQASTSADDCDDDHPTVYPGADEVCDGFKSDCTAWPGGVEPAPPDDELDNDADHHVGCTFASITTAAGASYTVSGATYGQANVTGDEDCDDTHDTVFPGNPDDLCDGLDNNCDNWSGTFPSQTPNLSGTEIDDDDDGYVECTFAGGVNPGNWGNPESAPVVGGDDCNDGSAATYPRTSVAVGSARASDETYEAADGCYTDGDDDGYGATSPASGADAGTDCNDSDPVIHPNQPELCDQKNNDCDNTTGEAGKISLEEPDGTWTDVTSAWVDSAPTVATPGTYWVCAGTFTTSPTITADGVTISGDHATTVPILDGGSLSRVVSIDNSGGTGTTLYKLTLDHGTTATDGGAIHIQGGGPVTLDTLTVRNSDATGVNSGGGGLYIDSGTIDIVNTTFTTNHAMFGGNICVKGGTVTLDQDTTLTAGSARNGGGLDILGGDVTVDGTVSSNQATDQPPFASAGGGVALEAGTLHLNVHATIDNNSSESHGGGLYMFDGSLADSGSRISNNTAGADGGGMYIEATSADPGMTLQGTLISTNHADSGSGGGIFMLAGTVSVTQSGSSKSAELDSNTAQDGGAIWMSAGTLSTDSLLLDNNTATGSGGGIYQVDGTSTHHGLGASLNAAEGGAGKGGGAIALETGTVTIDSDSQVYQNQAHHSGGAGNDGGAVLVFDDGTVDFDSSEVNDNSADDKGGAFRCFGGCRIRVADTLVHDNSADAGGAAYLGSNSSGDASFTCTATTPGDAGVYANSSASTDGGGVEIGENGPTVSSTDCDWGDTSGTTPSDNAPHDIASGSISSPFDYSGNVSFTCDNSNCQ